MTFQRVTIRTAKKEHKCGICQKKIQPGEKYREYAGKYDGDFYYGKECEPCQAIIIEYMESSYYDNEGYNEDNIYEWWRDVKCYDCQHRFLPCAPDDGCAKEFIKPDGTCPEKTKYGTCQAGDYCEEMTRYCWCEKFKQMEP